MDRQISLGTVYSETEFYEDYYDDDEDYYDDDESDPGPDIPVEQVAKALDERARAKKNMDEPISNDEAKVIVSMCGALAREDDDAFAALQEKHPTLVKKYESLALVYNNLRKGKMFKDIMPPSMTGLEKQDDSILDDQFGETVELIIRWTDKDDWKFVREGRRWQVITPVYQLCSEEQSHLIDRRIRELKLAYLSGKRDPMSLITAILINRNGEETTIRVGWEALV